MTGRPQYFPIPPPLLALACETVSRRVSTLPFLREGVMVTGDILGTAMECLNAEFSRTLAIRTSPQKGRTAGSGLDQCMGERLGGEQALAARVVAGVLCDAGIARMTEHADRASRRTVRAVRLLEPWRWDTMTVPAGRPAGGQTPPASWMSRCPVCRTGILDRVLGKQLFGIPRTDFYVECSYCGAKFIPVGTQFRLVSIANVRDPLWKRHLDQTYPEEEWAALARGAATGPAGPAGGTGGRCGQAPPAGIPPLLAQDASRGLTLEGRTLFFRHLDLKISAPVRGDHFARIRRPLGEVISHPAFGHLRPVIETKYSRFLSIGTGLFLSSLKNRHDPFYRELLHVYGDERFGTFRLVHPAASERSGVLAVAGQKGWYGVVDCPLTARTEIEGNLGRIPPEACLLSGDSNRCRINALLCAPGTDAAIYLYPSSAAGERARITEFLNSSLIS